MDDRLTARDKIKLLQGLKASPAWEMLERVLRDNVEERRYDIDGREVLLSMEDALKDNFRRGEVCALNFAAVLPGYLINLLEAEAEQEKERKGGKA